MIKHFLFHHFFKDLIAQALRIRDGEWEWAIHEWDRGAREKVRRELSRFNLKK